MRASLLLSAAAALLAGTCLFNNFSEAQQDAASRKLLKSGDAGPFRYIFSQGGSTYRLDIRVPAELPPGGPAPELFTVDHPPRIVLDVPIAGSITREGAVLKGTHFSGIRFGQHTDKTRLVFDLRGRTLPAYSLRRTGPQSFRAELTFPAADLRPESASRSLPEPAQSRTSASRSTFQRTARAQSRHDAAKSPASARSRVKTATLRKRRSGRAAIQQNTAARGRLQNMPHGLSHSTAARRLPAGGPAAQPVYRERSVGAIHYRMTAGGVLVTLPETLKRAALARPALLKAIRAIGRPGSAEHGVHLTLAGKTDYQLRQVGRGEYRIRLERTAASGSADAAICPPGGLVRAVVPETAGGRTDIRIFVEPEMRLRAQRTGDGIVLTAERADAMP